MKGKWIKNRKDRNKENGERGPKQPALCDEEGGKRGSMSNQIPLSRFLSSRNCDKNQRKHILLDPTYFPLHHHRQRHRLPLALPLRAAAAEEEEEEEEEDITDWAPFSPLTPSKRTDSRACYTLLIQLIRRSRQTGNHRRCCNHPSSSHCINKPPHHPPAPRLRSTRRCHINTIIITNMAPVPHPHLPTFNNRCVGVFLCFCASVHVCVCVCLCMCVCVCVCMCLCVCVCACVRACI